MTAPLSPGNPYQPPATPLVDTCSDAPIAKSLTIATAKGPLTLEARGDTINFRFGAVEKTIRSKKFCSNVFLVFLKTKLVKFVPVNVWTSLTEDQFRALLEFHGVDRYQADEIRFLRLHDGVAVVAILFFNGFGGAFRDRIFFDSFLLALFAIPFVQITLTFTRLFRLYYLLDSLFYLTLLIILSSLCYRDGDWIFAIAIPALFAMCWNKSQRFIYFSRNG